MSTPPRVEQQASKNPFRQSLLAKQKAQLKTPGEVGRALVLSLIVTLVLLPLALGAGVLSFRITGDTRADSTERVFLFVAGGFLFFSAMGGLIAFVRYLGKSLRPTKTVLCPQCGKAHRVWRNESFYACPNCLYPLHMRGQATELLPLNCPYCQIHFAASPDYGDLRCANCGTQLHIENAQVTYRTGQQTCSTCSNAAPAQAFGCRNCGTLLRASDALLTDESVEAMSMRDRFGLTLHVRGRLQELNRQLDTRAPAEKGADYYYLKAETLSAIMKMMLNSELMDQQANLTEMSRLVGEIDHTYAKSLLRAYAQVLYEPQTRYGAGVKPFFQEPPHAAVRAKLHQGLDQLRTQQGIAALDLGVAEWQKMPVAFKAFSAGSNSVNYQFLDPTPLKVEALRIWPDIESQIQRL